MKKTDVNMLSGSIVKGLLALTIPVMIMNVMQALFNIVDMTVLGNLVNDIAVGAVGACGVLINVSTGLFIGIATGANVIVAKYIGKKDPEGTENAVGTSLWFSVISGFILLIIGVIISKPLLLLTKCPDTLLGPATVYFKLYFLSVPFIIVYNFAAAILRATGDTRGPMVYLTIGGIVKVIMNIFCIVVLRMTVEGVAISTIISMALSAFLALRAVFQKKDLFIVSKNTFKLKFKELKEVLIIGIPTGFQTAVYSVANTVIATAVNSFGADATTGVSIANQFDAILYYVSCAPAVAAISYISQNIGAGNINRAKETICKSMLITVVFGASLGALSAIFSGQLSALMTSTPAVIRYSQQKMILISSTYFICGINEIMGAALKGIGRPVVPAVATLVFMCLIRFVWVYGIFPLCPNLTFLYLIWPIGWILSITTLLIAYFPTMRKLEKDFEKIEEISV